jgi:hypothetical protein
MVTPGPFGRSFGRCWLVSAFVRHMHAGRRESRLTSDQGRIVSRTVARLMADCGVDRRNHRRAVDQMAHGLLVRNIPGRCPPPQTNLRSPQGPDPRTLSDTTLSDGEPSQLLRFGLIEHCSI